MLRRMLVPLDTTEATTVATQTALRIVKREATADSKPVSLVGLGIVDLNLLPTGRFAGVVDRDKIVREASEKRDELVQAFQAEAKNAGLGEDRVEVIKTDGSPFKEIIRESVFCDLIVMGETCSFPPVNQDYETLHHVYHEASRPILLTHKSVQAAETVVMAMDGTAPSSRMMYQYVHLAAFPQARVVLTYSRQEEAQFNLTQYFTKVEGYLKSYGLNVSVSPVEGDMVEGLEEVVRKEGAQVVAIGIHREHFMSRLGDTMGLRQNFATRLVRNLPASLFLVH